MPRVHAPVHRALERASMSLLLPMLLGACPRADAPADVPADAPADTSTHAPSDTLTAVRGCSADARPSLEVTATDARTGAALGGFTVVLASDSAGSTTVLDSSSAAVRPPLAWGGPLERAGRFALRVRKAGYQPWDTTGVVVTRDECHVHTLRLAVRLVPQP